MIKQTVFVKTLILILFLVAINGWSENTSINAASGEENKTQLLINVDAFDNLTVAKDYYKKDFYGPEDIATFFRKCRENGVKIVHWRCFSEVASYPSKIEYSLIDVPNIPSNADERHYAGAFAAKVGVDNRHSCKLKELEGLNLGGIIQKITPSQAETFHLSGQVIAPPPGALLVVIDASSGKIIAQSKPVVSADKFQKIELCFQAKAPFYAGIMSEGLPEIHIIIADELSLKDSAGKEYFLNGGMEKSKMLMPAEWKMSGANFVTLNGDFRLMAPELKKEQFPSGDALFNMMYRPYTEELFAKSFRSCDVLAEAVKQAHLNGVKLYAWIDPTDDGRTVLPPAKAWNSRFMELHPEYRLVDQDGTRRWGILCFGYPRVREHKTSLIEELLAYGVDGIALKINFSHNMPWDGKAYDLSKFLFNDIALREYDRIWGKPQDSNYEIYRLQVIYGNFFIQWLRELRPLMHKYGKPLCLFRQPGNFLENMNSSWLISTEKIIKEKLIDELLLEPRIGGDNSKEIKRINEQLGYFQLCQRNEVKTGYTFHLNGLLGRQQADKHAFFREQMLMLANSGFNPIAIYEGMNVDRNNFWPDIDYVAKKIATMPSHQKLESANQPLPLSCRNLALYDNGGMASIKCPDNKPLSATAAIDGDTSSESIIAGIKFPVIIDVILPQAEIVNTVKIYPGNISYAESPSGICAPEAYRLEGLINDKWEKLVDDVTKSPANNKDVPGNCFIHQFSAVKTKAVRLTVFKSNDTGCRLFSPDKPVIPPDNRVTFIREIEVYNVK